MRSDGRRLIVPYSYSIAYPTYKGAKYDASTTNLTYTLPSPDKTLSADPIEIMLSFLSPITPTSTLRQSIPAAYLTIYVEGKFDVNIYIDVNGQWVSGKSDSVIEWGLMEQEAVGTSEPLKTWHIKRQTEQILTETNDQPEWGQLHFTGPGDVRHESGAASGLRQRFAKTGVLQNANDNEFRGIMDEEPVFAFAKEFKLGKNSAKAASKKDSVLFTITHIQDPVTQYASARGLTFMRPLWKSWFLQDEKLIQFHYGDFESANVLARNYSDQLFIDAYKSGSHNYVDIVALSARQAMGATSFSGTVENPLLFLKEISSNGNTQTVDVIFPAFPFFLYTNPRWGAYLLEPLIEHQLSGQYPNKYSMHDLGAHFPNLTGHADGRDEYMPVEECGDMLIMGLALVNSLSYENAEEAQSIWSTVGDTTYHTAQSEKPFALTNLGDHEGIAHIDDTWGGGAKGVKQAKKWLENSYDLWKQWTVYLVDFSLEPHNQRNHSFSLNLFYTMLTYDSMHRRLRRLARPANKPRPERYNRDQSLQRTRRPPRPHRRRKRTPQHLRHLHQEVARIRHLARWDSRQTRLRLVRQLDNPILALRRRSPLFPPLPHKRLHRLPTPFLPIQRTQTPTPPSPLTRPQIAPKRTQRPHPRHKKLHPHPNLQTTIPLVFQRNAKIRSPPRLAALVHQIRLAVRSRGRGI